MPPDPQDTTPIPPQVIVAATAGLIGAWVAAGSTGLLAHPLRHALTSLCAIAVVAALWPDGQWSRRQRLALAAGVAAMVAMTASPLPPINVAGVAVLLLLCGEVWQGRGTRVIWLAGLACAGLAIFRLAVTGIPLVWYAADFLGAALSALASGLTRQPLSTGASFGGVDFLVVMALLYAGWLGWVAAPRRRAAAYGAIGILGAHLVYLIALAFAPRLTGVLPSPTPEHPVAWAEAIRRLIPWNLPLLGVATHATVAACMLSWAPWAAEGSARPSLTRPRRLAERTAGWREVALLAALLPALTTLCLAHPSLAGKKVVLFEKGFLNWLKPEHGDYGQLSQGMYGLLQPLLESYGARAVLSKELTESDLADANVLVMLYPDKPWTPGQLERVHAFVRRGGSLLVFGEHTVREADGGARFNDALAPTSMRVPFDAAYFTVGGWLQSYLALSHPATIGLRDERNTFGVVIGASLQARWPASPMLVGRWGWSDAGDPGSEHAMLGNSKYDAGEQLGDIVLAAEQRVGAGRVIAFGDTSSMTNGVNMGAHVFTSRLIASAAGRASNPQAVWRQILALLVVLALAALLISGGDMRSIALACLVASASLALCTAISFSRMDALPDGRSKTPNNLAYIDTSHLESSASESWRAEGTMGLALTLIRNGYLPLDLPEVTAQRLQRAGVLVSIAPLRAFSRRERHAVQDFVNGGGIFICTVGYEERGPSRALLADFGFEVGAAGTAPGRTGEDSRPLGYFKSPYLDCGAYKAYVRFDAAWPVASTASGEDVVAYGPGDVPVIVTRSVGKGKVVVVGDTFFACNKNLEHEKGEPFEGMRENADFWRWFLRHLRGEPVWIPPPPAAQSPPDATNAEGAQ